MPIIEVKPIIDVSVRALCVKPYPGHQNGCPNFNKKPGCPLNIPIVDTVLDLSKVVYAVYNKFDFKKHTDKIRSLHPDWSDRQIKCCLYWQGTARKSLKAIISGFKKEYKPEVVLYCPEAMGVNVTETMKNAGIILEWPPETVTYQIVIAGSRLRNTQ